MFYELLQSTFQPFSNLKQKMSQKSTVKFHSLAAYYLSDEK